MENNDISVDPSLEPKVPIYIYEYMYILESNPHPFYSFRGLKIQMRIRIECGLDSRSGAGFWPNDRAGVCAVRTIQGGKNEVWIRFGCGLDLRIYGIFMCIFP
jgi:hypothetical protein